MFTETNSITLKKLNIAKSGKLNTVISSNIQCGIGALTSAGIIIMSGTLLVSTKFGFERQQK